MQHEDRKSSQESDAPDLYKTASNRKEKKGSFAYYIHESTLHGAKNILNAEANIQRFFWSMVFISMSVSLVITIYLQMKGYYDYPTRMNFKTELKNSIKFPAVTVCNLSPYRINDKTYRGRKLANYYLHSLGFGDFAKPIDWKDDYYANNTIEELRNNPKKKFIEECVYLSQSCINSLTNTMTEDGPCKTFNKKTKKAAVKTTDMTGGKNGLNFVLNIEQDNTPSAHLAAGVKVYLHDPTKEPEDSSGFFYASQGQITYAVIKIKELSLLGYPYKSFGDLYCTEVSGVSKITRSACISKCRTDNIQKVCKCKSFTDADNFSEECDCQNSCKLSKYELQISKAYFPSDAYVNQRIKDNLTDATYIRKNYLQITLYFDMLTKNIVEQLPLFTIEGILGNLGGQLGLFLGVSIITLMEILEAITLTVYYFIRNYKEEGKKRGGDDLY